jgi:hypothetical protein
MQLHNILITAREKSRYKSIPNHINLDSMPVRALIAIFLMAFMLTAAITYAQQSSVSQGTGAIYFLARSGNTTQIVQSATVYQGSDTQVVYLVLLTGGTNGTTTINIENRTALAENGIRVSFSNVSGIPSFLGRLTITASQNAPIGFYPLNFNLTGSDPTYNDTTPLLLYVVNQTVVSEFNITTTITNTTTSTQTTSSTTSIPTGISTLTIITSQSTTIPVHVVKPTQQPNNLVYYVLAGVVIVVVIIILYLYRRMKGEKTGKKGTK